MDEQKEEWPRFLYTDEFLEKSKEIYRITEEMLPTSIYRHRMGRAAERDHELRMVLLHVEKRLNDIENKVFRTAKKSFTTRAQQMLILYHLGLLEKINELPISKKKKAKLLSVLLNANADNIEGDLTYSQKRMSDLRIKENYSFLTELFQEVGLQELANQTDIVLDKLSQAK
jgi:hypothetical protein